MAANVIPDSEVLKQACRSCGALPKKPCQPSRSFGMHFARWEAAYEALHGRPPRVGEWSAESQGVQTFNNATFGRSA
jgi:hypothetical protein